jgi:hypothetical protein
MGHVDTVVDRPFTGTAETCGMTGRSGSRIQTAQAEEGLLVAATVAVDGQPARSTAHRLLRHRGARRGIELEPDLALARRDGHEVQEPMVAVLLRTQDKRLLYLAVGFPLYSLCMFR